MKSPVNLFMAGLGRHWCFCRIEYDPREQDNLIASRAWVFRPYMQAVGRYCKSLEKHPNPPGVSLAKFG